MQEVQKTESSVPAIGAPPSTSQGVLKSDIVIPKILQQQGLSEFVMDGRTKAGEIVRSTNAEVLGGKDKPMEFIPLKFDNLWMIQSQESDGKYKFRGYENRTAANETAEWEYFQDGVKMKRTKTMNLYALLPADIDKQIMAMESYTKTGEMPDLDAALLPVVISFRNTSFKAAKDVSTLFLKAESLSREMGVPVPTYGRTMKLFNSKEKNDKGEFYVMHVEPSGKTKAEYVAKAKFWFEQLNAMSFKVDDAEEVADDAPSAGPTNF